jgi:hypothetical protein
MQNVPRYWLGLVMFCIAAVFTVILGSVLQYRAIAQQATIAAPSEAIAASLLPPATRKASYFHY